MVTSPWAFQNVRDLLKASTETRLSPTNFKILDCFPPGTKVQDLDEKAYNIAVKWVRESTDGKSLDNALPSLPSKRARVTLDPQCGSPLHLPKIKSWGSKSRPSGRGGGRGPRRAL
ncbi:unnamed protein product [Malus baccata var. baccata]